ncbi:MAG TPA: winged helix-turn-helix domain-containing protein [Casimicrobiaceae bacterium]|jgi:DNA-binding transcriptional ArsR family regulator|nr:winged helix-turn-helix domain-containing protein [Casimicrobiaceae bacterium]
MSALRSLAALAQETRLRIFRLLVEHGPLGLPAGEIGRRLGLPPATLSFHIKELAAAGLVSARQQGRSIRYATDFAAMRGLVVYLSENCCRAPGHGDQLSACASDCSPRAAAEHAVFTIPKPTVRPKRRAA